MSKDENKPPITPNAEALDFTELSENNLAGSLTIQCNGTAGLAHEAAGHADEAVGAADENVGAAENPLEILDTAEETLEILEVAGETLEIVEAAEETLDVLEIVEETLDIVEEAEQVFDILENNDSEAEECDTERIIEEESSNLDEIPGRKIILTVDDIEFALECNGQYVSEIVESNGSETKKWIRQMKKMRADPANMLQFNHLITEIRTASRMLLDIKESIRFHADRAQYFRHQLQNFLYILADRNNRIRSPLYVPIGVVGGVTVVLKFIKPGSKQNDDDDDDDIEEDPCKWPIAFAYVTQTLQEIQNEANAPEDNRMDIEVLDRGLRDHRLRNRHYEGSYGMRIIARELYPESSSSSSPSSESEQGAVGGVARAFVANRGQGAIRNAPRAIPNELEEGAVGGEPREVRAGREEPARGRLRRIPEALEQDADEGRRRRFHRSRERQEVGGNDGQVPADQERVIIRRDVPQQDRIDRGHAIGGARPRVRPNDGQHAVGARRRIPVYWAEGAVPAARERRAPAEQGAAENPQFQQRNINQNPEN